MKKIQIFFKYEPVLGIRENKKRNGISILGGRTWFMFVNPFIVKHKYL
jgi:hypothetical protein